MKLREKIKRFWTLDVHNHEGFTLVELIIVIAILAILSSVAVVGYSSYVTKANKQADETMIAEIKNALTLAYYSGELSKSGFVVLTMADAADPSDDDVEGALLAAYGSLSGLKLKHTGWNAGSSLGSFAASINNSSYIQNVGTDILLKDVQNCSGKLAEFMTTIGGGKVFAGDSGASYLDFLLTNDSSGNGYVAGLLAGYADEDIDETVLANATVFGIANTLNTEAARNKVIGYFASGDYMTTKVSSLANVAHQYAALEAFVGYVNCKAATDALNEFNTNGMSHTEPDKIINALYTACTTAFTAVQTEKPDTLNAYYGLNNQDASVKSPAYMDGEAYVGIMQSVDELSGDYAATLGSSTLFTDNAISNDVEAYVALAALIATSDSSTAVAITFNIVNGGIVFKVFQ